MQRCFSSHLKDAVNLDQDQFTPLHALASALLDTGSLQESEQLLKDLTIKASTNNNRALLEHLKARILIGKGDLPEGFQILERKIARNRNLLPNLGVYADAKISEFDINQREFPATAAVSLQQAEDSVARGLKIEPGNQFLAEINQRLERRRSHQ